MCGLCRIKSQDHPNCVLDVCLPDKHAKKVENLKIYKMDKVQIQQTNRLKHNLQCEKHSEKNGKCPKKHHPFLATEYLLCDWPASATP